MGKKKEVEEKRVYDVELGDWDAGVFATSLVENPAIMSDFVFFSEDEHKIMMFANEEKQEVVGAIMIPDLLIPRKDENGDIFYVRFTKEVIETFNSKMKEYGYDKSFTFSHAYDAGNNVRLLESWIKEFDEDKSNGYGFDLPIGTLFMKVKVEEETLWNMVREKKLKGFSIELDASYRLNEDLSVLNKDEKMSKVEAFENTMQVNDNTLAYDGDKSITSDTILFQVVTETVDEKEVEKLQKFSGEFELDGMVFKSDKGIVTVEEKEVEKPEETKDVDLDGLLAKFTEAIDSKLEEFKTSFKEEMIAENGKIEESLEEVKLFQKQNKPKPEKKEEEKFNKVEVDVIENKKTLDDWYNKLKQ